MGVPGHEEEEVSGFAEKMEGNGVGVIWTWGLGSLGAAFDGKGAGGKGGRGQEVQVGHGEYMAVLLPFPLQTVRSSPRLSSALQEWVFVGLLDLSGSALSRARMAACLGASAKIGQC